MTIAEGKLPVAILVPGDFNDYAVGRIDKAFKLVRIERADPGLVTEEMRAAVRGIASYAGINAAMIDALPNLEIIASFGVGYDSVDANHAARCGVMVTNTPDVLTEEVADTAIGLLINTVRELYAAEKWLRDGDWVKKGNYPLSRLTLRGRSVGIFGMGRIGRAVARRLEAFGLPIAYHNRRKVEDLPYQYHATLKGLAEAVDTLICIAPGGASTQKAINAEILSALGSNGVFVNIGRGSAVDETALAAALESGTIAAAGLDVFADEPNVPRALLEAANASLLPHVGSASVHTRRAMADLCVDNLVAWFTERRPLTPVPETINVKARG
ncbi:MULTISPECIES: 2-hydroxyacid dehydrogenase [unclassified Mesorhizobium]|uniref:2-hydroxyacid dehydrogenase n=1 Tax=unclassified Mesorhizobium TaxID=325217 RepID=UPI000FDB3337|nr:MULTISPECIES: 2-hydroxyacid dehydrogenase [unclassified Mesorhizobium]TGT73433.1 2-hydroxyacid dehydrogenase [Mesorhizobium sp. M2E.F.Ca.ET.166.01.1.1]TGV99949.1 2-hydroxyacid dehydrogenase [Mesorhizobium sp. M2E.F.Ca.ET.154.01.1.1]